MSNERAETITTATKLERAPGRNVGARLRSARENRGLTIEELARKLFLNIQLVQQIEADDYKNLPGVTFMRGYLRAYASLVELDPETVIRDFNAMGLVDAPAPMSTQRIYHRDSTLLGRSLPWVGLASAIIVVLLVVMWIHAEYTSTALNEASASGGSAVVNVNQASLNANTSIAPSVQTNTPAPVTSPNLNASANSGVNYGSTNQANATNDVVDNSDTASTVATNDQTITNTQPVQAKTALKQSKPSSTSLAQNTVQHKSKTPQMATPF